MTRKMALVLFLLVLLATPSVAGATGLISTTIWGGGTTTVHQRATEHITVDALENVEGLSLVIRPVSISHTRPNKVDVTLNGETVCRFNAAQLDGDLECVVGDLIAGDSVDVQIHFQAKSVGLDEWCVYITHDNWVTPVGFALTVLAK